MGQVIQIGMDVSEVKTASDQLVAALQNQASSIEGVFLKLAEVNKQGEVTRQTFQGMAEDGSKVEATLKKVGDAWDVVGGKVRGATDAMKKAAAEQEAAAAKTRASAGESAVNGAFNLKGLNNDQAAQIEGSIQRIKTAMESGGVSVERFKAILASVKANPNKIIPDMTGAEQRLAANVRSIVASLDSVRKRGDDTNRIFISLAGVMRLVEAQVIKRIFRGLETEIVGAISAAEKFTIQIAEIRTMSDGAQLSAQKWGEQITALSSAFGRAQSDVAEGVFQTLSSQVVKGADAFKFMDTALGLAQATFSTAADSVKLLSGAMKSFQIPAEDAEKTASVLFKTVQLGHVRASEMSDTFAKLGAISRDAGLKLEEVSAAIITLNSRGLKFSEASSLIQSVIQKLLKPSEDMKKLFAEWGVSTGPAAIATFTFAGVLQKLDAAARQSTTGTGDLLKQFKAMRGELGLTGAAFDTYQESLKKVTDGQKDFQSAKVEGANSPGQRVTARLGEIRNFFEQSFGEPFLNFFNRVSDSAGGAVNVIKTLVVAVEIATATTIAWKVVQLANTAAMGTSITLTGAYAAAKGLFTATETSATAATAAFTVTAGQAATTTATLGATTTATTGAFAAFQIESLGVVASLSLLAGAFAVGAAAGYFLFIREGTKDVEAIAAAAKKFSEDQEKQNKSARDREAKAFGGDVEDTQKAYADRYRIVLQYSTSVAREAQKMREDAQKQLKAINEDMKVSAGTYFGNLRTEMSKFSEAVTQAKSLIKGSLKESEDLARRGESRVFDDKMKYASSGQQDPITGYIVGDQKVELLKNRIVQLAAKAREEFGKGTKESVEEGRKLFNDVEKLKAQLFDADVTKQKAKFEFDVKSGAQPPTSYDSAGRPRYEFTVRTAELERDITATTKERLALEEKFRAAQAVRQADAQKSVDNEKERIRAMTQQFALLEKINVYTDQGKLKPAYKGEGGIQKALSEFDERANKIKDLAGKDTDPQRGFQVFQDLARARAALVREIRDTMRAEQTSQIQEAVTKDTASVDKLAANAKAKFTEFQSEAARLVGGLNRQIGVYGEKLLAPELVDSNGRAANSPSEPARQEALSRLNALKSARDAFTTDGGQTVENAKKIQTAIDELNKSLKTYMDIRGLPPPEALTIKGDKSGMTVRDQMRATESVGDSLVSGATGVRDVTALLADARTQMSGLEDKVKSMPGAMQAMAAAAQAAGPSTAATFDSLAMSASKYADQLAAINAQMAQIKAAGPPPIPAAAGAIGGVLGNYSGGYPAMRYMSAGGYVGFVPRGSDQVPAMLGRNEFVMNESAADKFAPLLRAMNAGTLPGSAARNSQVTNVGDINVSVSGGQTDHQTINNIAKGLRRGIRRGTISLT